MHLAPLNEKSLTIPKLELQETAITSRFKVKILEETQLYLRHIYFWLKYIRNENEKSSVCVMNHISEIRTNAKIKAQYFIGGALNISDHWTRTLSFKDLAKESNDLEGPKLSLESLESVLLKADNLVEDNDTAQDSMEITCNRYR